MADRAEPFFLAKLNLKPAQLIEHSDLVWGSPTLTGLRSVLMKPEHLEPVPTLHRRLLAALEPVMISSS